jgi:hypothetical protein
MYIPAESSVPCWHEFKDSVAVLIGISHSQPLTNWIFHFLIIVRSAVSHVTHLFYKIRSCTRVARTFVLHVLDRPMPSSWTPIRPLPNYTHRFQTWWLITLPPYTSNGRDFLHEKHVLPKKDASITARTFRTTKFPTSLPLLNLSPAYESYVTCNPHYKSCLASQLCLLTCLVQPSV